MSSDSTVLRQAGWPLEKTPRLRLTGITTPGRAWPDVPIPRLPYFVGDLLQDLPSDQITTLEFAVTVSGGRESVDLAVLGRGDLMPAMHALDAERLVPYVGALAFTLDKDQQAIMHLVCQREGLFWEEPPRSHDFDSPSPAGN